MLSGARSLKQQVVDSGSVKIYLTSKPGSFTPHNTASEDPNDLISKSQNSLANAQNVFSGGRC